VATKKKAVGKKAAKKNPALDELMALLPELDAEG
jgi:hypothetical protein